ncbi:restriction endonuclease subunit S [Algoriphagus hitonicola]|uniref:Type I restriction enzyme, S subunit n=1 Tax=Algoriphagus hitonicola TaxID=435880 RepID=A0A1I2SAI4_9BACT|nr:restriction endonuclease subunit S [Algoriphagus hitonicola]SFG49780.1 type I restriction enzyme, S subunit [Algoriphagus hitonicola]
MMEDWKEHKFSEIADFPPKIKMEKGKEYPFVLMDEVDAGFKYVRASFTKIYDGSGAKFENGDTLFARITPSLENGKIAQIKDIDRPAFGSTEFFVFRGKKNVSDCDFIYYLSKTDWFRQNAINSFVGASGRQRADAKFVGKTILKVPPLHIQQKIAKILSSYDDLIETNLQRIKLLDELAQNTFNEMYSANKEFEEVNLGSLIGHEIGGGWGNDELTDEFNKPAYVIRGTDIDELPNGKLEKVPFRYHKKSNLASRKLQDGDIIFEVSGGSSYEGVAKTLLVTEELLKQFDNAVMPASFCKLARPGKREYSSFLFLFLRFLRNIRGTEVFEIRSASNIVNYNWTAFLKFQKVKKPSDDVLEKFNAIVEPIYKQIYILGNQNQYLKEARDILLPRLMTGMIDVSEINTELSMAAEDGVEYGKVENI